MFVHRKNLSWWIQQEFVGHNRVLLFKRLPAKKNKRYSIANTRLRTNTTTIINIGSDSKAIKLSSPKTNKIIHFN